MSAHNYPQDNGNADLVSALGCGQCAACALTARRGFGFVHCPGHPDEHPSLSIDTRGRKVLFRCWAGCAQAEVVQALRERRLWRSRR